jgi:hypothetical protein
MALRRSTSVTKTVDESSVEDEDADSENGPAITTDYAKFRKWCIAVVLKAQPNDKD